jgi:hypothetical protein
MPPPGFPDWLCPGAVVMPMGLRGPAADRNIVLAVGLVPPGRGSEEGFYNVVIATLGPSEHGTESVGQSTLTLHLTEFLRSYDWMGEYITPEGHIVLPTPAPVTLRTAGIREGELLSIEGSAGYDGVYQVTDVHAAGFSVGPTNTSAYDTSAQEEEAPSPDEEDVARRLAEARSMLQEAERVISQHNITAETFLRTTDGLTALWDGDRDIPEQTPDEYALAQNEALDPEPLMEGDIPRVSVGQVWMLPRPNLGRWRVDPDNGWADGIRLVAVQDNREMRCTRAWLIQHGVRDTPPDPRSRRTVGQIAIGQVWEIHQRRHAGQWRVIEINERANRVRLNAEDGSGKRVYLTPTVLMRNGTYVGDGLPRRTAFERVLDDDNE